MNCKTMAAIAQRYYDGDNGNFDVQGLSLKPQQPFLNILYKVTMTYCNFSTCNLQLSIHIYIYIYENFKQNGKFFFKKRFKENTKFSLVGHRKQ